MGLDFAWIAPGTKTPLPWRHVTPSGEVHAWPQSGTSRVHMKAGCSICRGFRASETTSLAACKPLLAAQWHPTKNGSRTPHEVTPGSRRVVWWLCPDCNYAWPARISSRALGGNGCTRCAGQVALPGDRATLAVAQPDLYAELDVERLMLSGVDPLTVHVRSNREVPWICDGTPRHRWTMSPAARMNGCLCPECPHLGQTSRPEQTLLNLMRQRTGNAVSNAPAGEVRWLDRRGRSLPARCDIVLPALRVVVEYDGWRYHDAANRRRCDRDKTMALLNSGWRVVRVRERTASKRLVDLDIIDERLLQIQHRYGHDLAPVADAIIAWVTACDG
ncbi:hypothetical protein EUA94_17825 [Nocardioides zhouii]|uniref:Treble clef zinc finger domain-containing protein n=1 Tax=Nocardioides zhouii TaxID=1168729 RepID=A0A4Q2SNU1_9ACTN|nr:hypothetical protein EUA94_17825 [Nocardioides zhouii]